MFESYDTLSVGNILRKERELLGDSQEKFSEKICVTRTTIVDWENGKRFPPLEKMLLMCNHFKCDLGYLLGEYSEHYRDYNIIRKETGLSEKALEILFKGTNKTLTSIGDTVLLKGDHEMIVNTINILVENPDLIRCLKDSLFCNADTIELFNPHTNNSVISEEMDEIRIKDSKNNRGLIISYEAINQGIIYRLVSKITQIRENLK